MTKPKDEEAVSIPLKFGKKKGANGTNGTVNPDGSVPLSLNGKRNEPQPAKPNGVGFVDFSDDLDDPVITGEDDLIDEDEFITEADLARPVIQRISPVPCVWLLRTNRLQRPSASPNLESDVALARTALAA